MPDSLVMQNPYANIMGKAQAAMMDNYERENPADSSAARLSAIEAKARMHLRKDALDAALKYARTNVHLMSGAEIIAFADIFLDFLSGKSGDVK